MFGTLDWLAWLLWLWLPLSSSGTDDSTAEEAEDSSSELEAGEDGSGVLEEAPLPTRTLMEAVAPFGALTVIVTTPSDNPVMIPFSTLATVGSEETQVSWPVDAPTGLNIQKAARIVHADRSLTMLEFKICWSLYLIRNRNGNSGVFHFPIIVYTSINRSGCACF